MTTAATTDLPDDLADVDDDVAEGQPGDEPPTVGQQDVLALAEQLLIGANNALAKRGSPPSIERQITLGQAIATLELAKWTRAQYALQAQMVVASQAAAQRAAETAKGPSGIVVPSMTGPVIAR